MRDLTRVCFDSGLGEPAFFDFWLLGTLVSVSMLTTSSSSPSSIVQLLQSPELIFLEDLPDLLVAFDLMVSRPPGPFFLFPIICSRMLKLDFPFFCCCFGANESCRFSFGANESSRFSFANEACLVNFPFFAPGIADMNVFAVSSEASSSERLVLPLCVFAPFAPSRRVFIESTLSLVPPLEAPEYRDMSVIFDITVPIPRFFPLGAIETLRDGRLAIADCVNWLVLDNVGTLDTCDPAFESFFPWPILLLSNSTEAGLKRT